MKISRKELRKMINESMKKKIRSYDATSGFGFYGPDDMMDVRTSYSGKPFARAYMTDNLPTPEEVANVLMTHYMESLGRGNLEQGGLIDVARAVSKVLPPADPAKTMLQSDGFAPKEQDFDEVVKKVSDILISAEMLLSDAVSKHHLGVIYGMVVDDMVRKLERHGYRQKFEHFQGVRQNNLY